MTQEHPITPPPELVQKWWPNPPGSFIALATQAARWGADQELEACCEWLETGPYGFSIEATAPSLTKRLRKTRRPKPPSLKEQALNELIRSRVNGYLKQEAADIIIRALEELP